MDRYTLHYYRNPKKGDRIKAPKELVRSYPELSQVYDFIDKTEPWRWDLTISNPRGFGTRRVADNYNSTNTSTWKPSNIDSYDQSYYLNEIAPREKLKGLGVPRDKIGEVINED